MKDRLGVAILGGGFMGGMHYEGWRHVQNASVKGVWTWTQDKTEVRAKEWGVRAYKSLPEILNDDGVDVIDVSTPSYTHPEYSIKGMRAGKHVFVEKPMALSLKDANAMISTAARQRVKLMVGHVLRFFPEYAKAKELVDSGTIGEPVIGRTYRAGYLPIWNSWFTDFRKSGGVAVDMAIHDVDFLLWCFNEPVTTVFAKVEHLKHKKISSHDFAIITLRFKGGGVALVEASWAVPKEFPFTMKLDLDGTKGMVQLDNQTPVPVRLITDDKNQTFAPETLPWEPAIHPFPVDPFYRELQHFANCIRDDQPPMTGGDSSRKSLEVCLAALRSAKRDAPVRLPLEGC